MRKQCREVLRCQVSVIDVQHHHSGKTNICRCAGASALWCEEGRSEKSMWLFVVNLALVIRFEPRDELVE